MPVKFKPKSKFPCKHRQVHDINVNLISYLALNLKPFKAHFAQYNIIYTFAISPGHIVNIVKLCSKIS
jgi:hypothetical protein